MSDEFTTMSDPRHPVSSPGFSVVFNRIRQDEEFQRAEQSLLTAIARNTRTEIVPTSIEGRHICFMGNGPYKQEHLEKWVEKLGAFARSAEFDVSEADWFVLGRSDFDHDFLCQLAYCDVRYFSQEEFLGVLLFGEEVSLFYATNQTTNPHPAFEWLEFCDLIFESYYQPGPTDDYPVIVDEQDTIIDPSQLADPAPAASKFQSLIPLPRPVQSQTSDEESFNGSIALLVESELKKLGYSVAVGVTLHHRRASLVKGVQALGYPKVANHLMWLMRVGRKNPYHQNAVLRWNEDLNWLNSQEAID